MNIEINPGLHWICITLLLKWQKKSRHSLSQKSSKLKSNHFLVARGLTRLKKFIVLIFELLVVL